MILDLAGGRPLGGFVGTHPAPAPSAWGEGLLWQGNGSAWFAQDTAIQTATAGGAYSFACGCVPTTSSQAADARPFGRTGNNGSAPGLNWGFQVVAFNNWQGLVYNGTAGTEIGTANYSGAVAQTFISLAGTVGGGSGAFYAQGTPLGGPTSIMPADYDTLADVIFAGSSSAEAMTPFTGFVFYGAFWARVLSPAEILALHQDPYAVLEWPSERLHTSLAALNLTTDRWASIESGITFDGATAQVEAGAKVVADPRVPAGLVGTAAATPDARASIELGAGLTGNAAAAVEAMARADSDSASTIETLSSTGEHETIPVANSASASGDTVLNSASSASDQLHLVFSAEPLGSQRIDHASRVENSLRTRGDAGAAPENMASMFLDPATPAESGARPIGDESLPVESLAARAVQVRVNLPIPVERLAAGRADLQSVAETRGTYVVSVTLTLSDGRVIEFPAMVPEFV